MKFGLTDIFPKSSRIADESPVIDAELPSNPSVPILNGLESIKNKYEEAVKIRAKEYAESQVVAPDLETDDELIEKAKESIEGKFADQRAKTEQKAQEELEELIERKKEKISDYSDKLRTLERESASKERKMTEAFSKNDMTHSSTFELRKQQLKDDYVYDRAKLDADRERQIAYLDKKIENVEAAYQAAISSFEISYAIALEDKKTSLIEKRDRLLNAFESTKDEKLDKQEKAFYKIYEKENAEYEEAFNDYKDDKKENYEERLRFAVEKTNALTKSQKERLLKENKDALRNYLGLYYRRYLKEIGG